MNPLSPGAPEFDAFQAGLRDFGYVDGVNLRIETRFAEGRADRLPGLAAELVASSVDVILTVAGGVYAARAVTTTVPIVMAAAADVVAMGLAASLAHPGGDVTGLTFLVPEIMAKRLAFLKERAPSMTRAGLLLMRGSPSNANVLAVFGAAAAMKVEPKSIEVGEASELGNAISAAADEPIGGLVSTDHQSGDRAGVRARTLAYASRPRRRRDRMRRREFLLGAGAAAAWPAPARAEKIPRIGYFWPGFQDPNVGLAGLRQGLADRGFVVGQNLVLEERYAEGRPERGPDLIAELLGLGIDVLVTGGAGLIRAHTLTTTVPLVGVAGNFVGVGLAAALSRPGGNVTGLSLLSADFSPKWLEYLQAAVPKLGRVAFLGTYSGTIQLEKLRLEEAAPRFGVTLTTFDLWRDNLETSLGAITSANFDGLIVADDVLAEPLVPRIVALAAQTRMPTIYGISTAVRQGGLMSYSADFFEIWRRLAGPIARVLEGARPGDIPIEQATEIKLAINLKTAKALGLDVPVSLLAAATEVIE